MRFWFRSQIFIRINFFLHCFLYFLQVYRILEFERIVRWKMFASEFSSGLEDIDRPKVVKSQQIRSKVIYSSDWYSISLTICHVLIFLISFQEDGLKAKPNRKKTKAAVEERVFKPSLFRKNPEVPHLKPDKDVVPIHETLFSSQSFADFSEFHAHMVRVTTNNFIS